MSLVAYTSSVASSVGRSGRVSLVAWRGWSMEGGSCSVLVVGIVGIRARVVVGVVVVVLGVVGTFDVVAVGEFAGVLEVWFVVGSRDEGGA